MTEELEELEELLRFLFVILFLEFWNFEFLDWPFVNVFLEPDLDLLYNVAVRDFFTLSLNLRLEGRETVAELLLDEEEDESSLFLLLELSEEDERTDEVVKLRRLDDPRFFFFDSFFLLFERALDTDELSSFFFCFFFFSDCEGVVSPLGFGGSTWIGFFPISSTACFFSSAAEPVSLFTDCWFDLDLLSFDLVSYFTMSFIALSGYSLTADEP